MYPEEDNRLPTNVNVPSNFYGTTLPHLNVDLSSSINSSSIIHPEIVVTEDLLAGQRPNGRMSSVRRFFCLFVTFDLLFTSLMWLICIMLNGDSIWTALDKEVYHYEIHTSLFDIVLAAICRFVVLLLFYGLLYINHWLIIALSTAGTCIFLISKVFLFTWQDSPQPVFQVLLILTSFVLSWGEAWFLDFRVIPQEVRASQVIISTPDTERTPLLRSYMQGLPSACTESVANFYSPQGSPTSSVHRFGEQSNRSTRLTADQVKTYRNTAAKTSTEAWELLNDENWKIIKLNIDDDVISSLTLTGENRKIYKISALINVKPRVLLDELFYRVENIPKWDSALIESRKLEVIDDHTDITYQISAKAAGGIVASRDFISLRIWNSSDKGFLIAITGIDYPPMPETSKYIRGRNGIGCVAIYSIEHDPNSCQFEWILNSDLKAWFPSKILEPAYVNLLFEYVKNLRTHLKSYDDL
ncbi:Cholesterol-capturing domain [Popillia japonica]|uniref:Cholesterol-capturing domain n=1 Tax=Popillia japonica TaxID=7064 RepID=A0AAW1LSM0_POPJA